MTSPRKAGSLPIRLVIVALVLAIIAIYFFVTAPPALSDQQATASMDIRGVFEIVEHENDVARSLYTDRIVKSGQGTFLKFGEDWKRVPGLGPLPALFLRETSQVLERNSQRLSLFLGSDKPIEVANKFTGQQLQQYQELLRTGKPVFFFAEDTKLHVGMFPDLAVSDACVDCHNNDERGDFHDWKRGDIMGATSWTYPDDKVSIQQALQIISAVRQSIYASFEAYLLRTETFPEPPMIGSVWPDEGFGLPSVEQFATEHQRLASSRTLELLFSSGASTN